MSCLFFDSMKTEERQQGGQWAMKSVRTDHMTGVSGQCQDNEWCQDRQQDCVGQWRRVTEFG